MIFVAICVVYALVEAFVENDFQYPFVIGVVIGIFVLIYISLKNEKTPDEATTHKEEQKTLEASQGQWIPQSEIMNQENVLPDEDILDMECYSDMNYYMQPDTTWIDCDSEREELQQSIENQNEQKERQQRLKETLAKKRLDKQLSNMVDTMSGEAYENYVGYKLLEQGWRDVDYTSKTNDYGADIIAKNPEGELVCIQCKRYADSVGIAAIQEVSAAKLYYNCKHAIAVTNSTFTPNAKELAKRTDVELWENFR